jgi:hypothetical protein
MRQYHRFLRQERAALKIQVTPPQAAYRSYLVRKLFLAARLRFENIVKSLDGTDIEVSWPYDTLCRPAMKDLRFSKRLKKLVAEERGIEEELRAVRAAIQRRKEHLLVSLTS